MMQDLRHDAAGVSVCVCASVFLQITPKRDTERLLFLHRYYGVVTLVSIFQVQNKTHKAGVHLLLFMME